MSRLVVVLFGASGAGKTTIARSLPLQVFDRDDPEWFGRGETVFRSAIKQLAHDPKANAVVIRAGATSSARRRSLVDVGATHAFLVMPPKDVCHQQAGHRRRQDVRTSHASIETYYAGFDHDDQMARWPGSWEQALNIPLAYTPTLKRACDTRNKAGDPRGTRAWRRLREQVFSEETVCWRCGTWVDQTLPARHPMSRTADHLDAIANGGAGIPDRSRVRLSHWTCNSKRGKGIRVSQITRTELVVSLDSV